MKDHKLVPMRPPEDILAVVRKAYGNATVYDVRDVWHEIYKRLPDVPQAQQSAVEPHSDLKAKWLGDALFDCIKAAKILRDDIHELTVAEILHFSKDLKEYFESEAHQSQQPMITLETTCNCACVVENNKTIEYCKMHGAHLKIEDKAISDTAKVLLSSTPPKPTSSDCTGCRNTDSWGLPDKPVCDRCVSGSAWIPLNQNSVNPNKITKQQQPAVEPYGWHVTGGNELLRGMYAQSDAESDAERCGGTARAIALYTAPPPPADVPLLTDEEREEIIAEKSGYGKDNLNAIIRATEQAVRQKVGLK